MGDTPEEQVVGDAIYPEPASSQKPDELFGNTSVNYNRSTFGVIDLTGDLVQTHSGKVRVSREHVQQVVTNPSISFPADYSMAGISVDFR